MRTLRVPLIGLFSLVLTLAAPSARAQEEQGGFGLDLSGEDTAQPEQEAPAEGEEQPGSLGLDLSGDTVSKELLPRVVLLGLDTPERAGAAMASRWLRAIYTAIRTNNQWVLSSPLKEVREKLADGYAAALRCGEASCLAEPADTLEADLLVTSRLALEDDGWTLRLWTYDRDRKQVETDVLTGRSPRDAKFQRAGAELLAQRIQGLARQRSILQVKVNVPQAVARLGERILGVGNLEVRVAPGEANLFVEAEGFSSFAKTITLKPGERNTVEVYLELSCPAPDSPPSEVVAEAMQQEPSEPTIFSRPALYTAVLGVLVMGAGVVVGQQATEIANRAPDANGDGIADITRRERLEGRDKANLSTALVSSGAAVAGGSALWLFLMPTRSEPAKSVAPVTAPAGASGGTTSLHLIVGGSF
jgi:hypothetical protein